MAIVKQSTEFSGGIRYLDLGVFSEPPTADQNGTEIPTSGAAILDTVRLKFGGQVEIIFHGNFVVFNGIISGISTFDDFTVNEITSFGPISQSVFTFSEPQNYNLVIAGVTDDVDFFARLLAGDDDIISTNRGASTMGGFAGNDYLEAALPVSSLLDGGAGDDTILVHKGFDSLVNGGVGDDEIKVVRGTRHEVQGGNGSDTVTVHRGNDHQVNGGFGNDEIIVFKGTGHRLLGGNGDDTLRVTDGTGHMLFGGSGNDTLQVDGGTDHTLLGGEGDDILKGGVGEEWLVGGKGNDSFIASTGFDRIKGGPGRGDHIEFEASINNFTVTQFGDLLRIKGGGIDTTTRSVESFKFGLDEYTEAQVSARVGALDDLPTNSSDTLQGTSGPDVINGLGGGDTITGGGGRDKLLGGRGNDVLIGQGASDNLFGGRGQDTIFGGGGNDRLTGNKGMDVFVFNGGNDIVTDFADNDLLRLDDDLWSGTLTKAQVLDFAAVIDGDTVFEFGGGHTLTLEGYTSIAELEAGLTIF